jgi:hypothetical protein
MLRRAGFMMVCASVALASGVAPAQSDIDSTPAFEAARIFLATLDAGRYGESWEDAAPALRESMTRVQWETGLVAARAPLGVLIVRKIREASCSRGTGTDPATEICVIRYDTRFENRPVATEIAMPIRGRDGTWRVASYVLR